MCDSYSAARRCQLVGGMCSLLLYGTGICHYALYNFCFVLLLLFLSIRCCFFHNFIYSGIDKLDGMADDTNMSNTQATPRVHINTHARACTHTHAHTHTHGTHASTHTNVQTRARTNMGSGDSSLLVYFTRAGLVMERSRD